MGPDHGKPLARRPERPQRVAIVGGSYIAVELAGIFAGLGSQTTLSLRGETVLRGFDAMLGEATLGNLRGQGVEVRPANLKIAENVPLIMLWQPNHDAVMAKNIDGYTYQFYRQADFRDH